MGVGDIGEVQGGAGGAGIEAGSGDSRPAIGERDAGVVDGRAGAERGARDQHGGKWWSVSDGAGDEDGDGGLHGAGSGGAHGMRGDGVGVGDIGEVQGGAGGAGVEAGCGDSRRAIGERDRGVVDGRGGAERGARDEHGGKWWSVSDGAGDEDGDSGVHGAGSGGADGMRGDGVGVGDIGAVQDRKSVV